MTIGLSLTLLLDDIKYGGRLIMTKEVIMQISISELKTNPGKYVALADELDIFITKNGKKVAKLTSARPDKVASAKALFGILPANIDLATMREERLR